MEQDERDDFRVWSAGQPKSPYHLGMVGATVKLGPRVCKTVQLALFGDGDTGEVKKRVLRLSAFDRQDGGFDFEHPSVTWYCENEEIERLLAFLKRDVDQPGRYRVIDSEHPLADLVAVVSDRPDDLAALVSALEAGKNPELLGEALAESASGVTAAELAVISNRRDLLARASEWATDPTATETHMQELIGSAWWVFGGRYVGVLPRRDILHLDQHDIPLLCADGSLHIVELKSPRVPLLIRKHRNHWIVGGEVHEAVMQAANYVRTADELGAGVQRNLQEELGIEVDLRRVFATVVIGHRAHLDAAAMPAEQFDLALRTYNATLNRTQVVTYDQLFDAAGRALAFDPCVN